MLDGIFRSLSCCAPVQETLRVNSSVLQQAIRVTLEPFVKAVTICDRPTRNQSGLTQYHYDDNRDAIRQRRVAVAREFDLSLSDAPFDRRFVAMLAAETERAHGMPGQCAEMASLSAIHLQDLARDANHQVYTLQLPDCNHTITLLSPSVYRAKEWVDWNQEFEVGAVVVDLWQGALSQDNPAALVSAADENRYTKISPRALVQCDV